MTNGRTRNISSSKELTEKIIARLGKMPEPFFLWVHYFDPHSDYLDHPGFTFSGGKDIDRYDSEVAFTDYQINRLLSELKRRSLFDKTLIVVVSDHGEEFQDHGGSYHTATLYEELIHVPLIMRVPGFKHDRINEVVVESEIAPTIVGLVGLSTENFEGDGIPFDRDGFKAKNKTVYSETRRAINLSGILENGYKLIMNHDDGSVQLYDLRQDPSEKHDLASAESERVNELKDKLMAFYEKPHAGVGSVEPDNKTLENLRNLGYVV